MIRKLEIPEYIKYFGVLVVGVYCLRYLLRQTVYINTYTPSVEEPFFDPFEFAPSDRFDLDMKYSAIIFVGFVLFVSGLLA